MPQAILKFGWCTVLSSSSPVIEASKLVKVESQSDSISAIEAPASMWLVDLCAHCIDN